MRLAHTASRVHVLEPLTSTSRSFSRVSGYDPSARADRRHRTIHVAPCRARPLGWSSHKTVQLYDLYQILGLAVVVQL